MSFEFQSTLVNVTPNFRISGAQIGGVRILYNGDIKVARLVVTNDRDIQFALSGPYEAGDPDAIYAALSGDLYELTPGILINEGAISSIEMTAEQLIIDLEGSDLKYAFEPDAAVTAPVELNSHNYKLPPASFTALSAAAAIWRSSMDGTLEGLATTIATETADRISADAAIQADVDQNEADADAAMAAEIARVDALIASGMWLYADQASFPPAADNHGRVVHSHADGAIFYAHGGAWHQVAKEVDLQTTISSLASEASAREAADNLLDGRLDVLEADPTTATAVAAGDAATLSSANGYTDTSISSLVNGADAALDTLKEIGDALAQGDSDVTAALTAQITTESTTRANADAALSGRLDTLEADPTTQTLLDAEVTARTTADTALDGRIAVLENDPTTATALAAVQADVDQNESDSDTADAALSARLDVLEADPTTATALAAVQSDVDQNESDADAAIAGEATTRGNADAALSGRLDVLEADPTTATAVAAVQADVDQNEVDGDAADAALSGRLDVLEADPTTATAVAAVQSDVDQNEADADAALALKAPLADPDFTGQLDVDTNARIEFADNLTKIHNVLRGTSINIGNNIEMKPAAAGGRVEITGDLILDFSDMVDAANDGDAATAGVQIGGVYRHGNDLKIRIV